MNIEVLDSDNNKITGEVIKIIRNDNLNKMYIVYEDNNDILVSELLEKDNEYQISPVLNDEWNFIEESMGNI